MPVNNMFVFDLLVCRYTGLRTYQDNPKPNVSRVFNLY